MSTKIPSNTKVTLTLKQLTKIVESAVEKKVTSILNEYINNGLLGNPEVIHLQENNNELVQELLDMEERFNRIKEKIANGSSANYQEHSENIGNDNLQIRSNEHKFSGLRENFLNSFKNNHAYTTNEMFGGQVNSIIDESIPVEAQIDNPIAKAKIVDSVKKIKQQAKPTPQQETYFDMIMSTEGILK